MFRVTQSFAPFDSLPFSIQQDGTVERDEMRATATDGNARIFMAGKAERWWAEGFVAKFDFAAIVLDIGTTVNSTMSPATSRPATFPSPFPTTSSSTARSDQTSPFVAVIAGAVAGVAVVVLVVALVVCCRKRVGRRKAEKSLLPRPSQATNIPLPSGCTYVDALPGEDTKEAEGVPPYTSDCTYGREPARVGAQNLIAKPTHVIATTSTVETASVPMEVDTESPPLHDPRADPNPEGANPVRATNMSSGNRASTVYAGKPSRSTRLPMAEAVMEAAAAVANSSSVPGVSEAATLISTLVKLVVERQNNDSAAEWRLRWCRSIVTLLGQASEILGKVRQ